MKKILNLTLILVLSNGAAIAQNQWEEIVYHYQTGTVPPPYYYSYDLTINPSGTGTLVYSPNYGKDTTWVYNITLSEDDVNRLSSAISESGVLTGTISELPDSLRPIGGALQNISIQQPRDPNLDQTPGRIVVPYFPKPEFREKIMNLYSQIKKMVPQSIWDEIDLRKGEYIKNHKK
jgi:hypothetical protein